MSPFFTPKRIVIDSGLGAKLKQARAYRGLGLEMISQRLKIKTAYLEALEEDDYDHLPRGLYHKSYLKKYADFLGLSREDLVVDSVRDLTSKMDEGQNPFSQPLIKKSKLMILPQIIRNFLIALVIVICLFYLALYVKKIFFAPYLILEQPNKNLVQTDNTLVVIGQTEPEAEVRINNELVLDNKDGRFSQTLTLKKGLNNIVITAQKKYSRIKTVIRQILIP